MGLKRITDAATEPVTLAEAKAHLRVTTTSEDALIANLIKAARMDAENITQRSFITQTWERAVDQFGEAIELTRSPVIAITSVKYDDVNGSEQTLSGASYQLDNYSEPGWLVPAFSYDWPQTRAQANAVRVRYTAGYGAAADVPKAIAQWILIRVGQLYEHREQVVTGISVAALPSADALLDTYRILTV